MGITHTNRQMPSKKAEDSGDESSGQFYDRLKPLAGAKTIKQQQSTEREARKQAHTDVDGRHRRHRHAAGKKVIVHEGEEDYRETARTRRYRKRAEEERRYMAVVSEERERRLRRRQRRDERRALRRQRQVYDDHDIPLQQPNIAQLGEDEPRRAKGEGKRSKKSRDAPAGEQQENGAVKSDASSEKAYGKYAVKDDLNAAHKKTQEDGSLIVEPFAGDPS